MRMSDFDRAVAALVPAPLLAGPQANALAASLPVARGLNSLAYLAMPAISMFVLIGAALLSAMRIRQLRQQQPTQDRSADALRDGVTQWWRQHRTKAIVTYIATIAALVCGASWAVFAVFILSFGLLIHILKLFARLGVGNRALIGKSCAMGLALLGQVALIPPLGFQGIHLVDPSLAGAILWIGALLVAPLAIGGGPQFGGRIEPLPRWLYAIVPGQLIVALILWLFYPNWLILATLLGAVLVTAGTLYYRARMSGQIVTSQQQRWGLALGAALALTIVAWHVYPIARPVTPGRVRNHVATFHEAPYGAASWQRWEIVSSWAIDRRLDPNLSGARRLLAKEIAGQQNPFVLGTAFRLGLVQPEQIAQLRDLAARRAALVDDPHHVLVERQVPSLEQEDWVIRALASAGQLPEAERDMLATRLRVTLDELSRQNYDRLRIALRATQLLDAIDRSVDKARYQARIHDWLRDLHTRRGGGFELPGGFKLFPGAWTSSLEATSDAVELMEIYGKPSDLDINWVRSYLRPHAYRFGDQQWIAAVTLDRVNRLTGVEPVRWFELLYYERSLIAAAVLVGLCLYATLISPRAASVETTM